MAEPPSLAGAVQETSALALWAVAVAPVGARGLSAPAVAAGVTGLEAADAGLVPTALVAVTVKV